MRLDIHAVKHLPDLTREMFKLTQAAVARDWSVSREYIRQCVQKGMVLESLEGCRLWRKANTSKRATTSPVQIARQLSEEADDDSPEARERRKAYLADKPDGTVLPSQSLEDALYHAIELENEAFRMCREAMHEQKESKIQIRLAIHNKAQENRCRIETMIREELAARESLIPFDRATEIFRRGLDVILRRLKRLPQEKAPACNPQNPLHALGILEASIDSIITEAQGQYAPAAA